MKKRRRKAHERERVGVVERKTVREYEREEEKEL